MLLTGMIKDTLKIGSLDFLLNINNCNLFDPKKRLIDAVLDKDLKRMQSCWNKKNRARQRRMLSDFGLEVHKKYIKIRQK